MDAYYSGREVLPALQLRALPAPAYRGCFAIRPTGNAFQFQIADGALPPEERLSAAAGHVLCSRLYVPSAEGDAQGNACIRILRIRLQLPPQNLTLSEAGTYYVYLNLTVQSGSDPSVGCWNDPLLGTCCMSANYTASQTAPDTPGDGRENHLLLGVVTADSCGALEIRQLLHGEPQIIVAMDETEESSGSESESASFSDASTSETAESASGTGEESGESPEPGETSSGSGESPEPGGSVSESSEGPEISVSESWSWSGSSSSSSGEGSWCSGKEGSGCSESGSASSSSSSPSSSSEEEEASSSFYSSTGDALFGNDERFYVVQEYAYQYPNCEGDTVFDFPCETYVIQGPFALCRNYYVGGRFIWSVSRTVQNAGCGFDTYAEAEEFLEQ